MFSDILVQSWNALARNPTRSLLTMLGIVWGIVAVTILIAYGDGFRTVLVKGFDAFGQSAVVCWPGQTGEQAGGQRAGKRVRFEKADMENVLNEASLVKQISLETVRWYDISFGDRFASTAIRGVYVDYGDVRNEKPERGRWISDEDFTERRRVVVIGAKLSRKLFSGQEPVDQTVRINGVRFTVIGIVDKGIQLSNYFNSDDESAFIPYSTAGDLWDTRYASTMVFSPVSPQFEKDAIVQVRATLAKRQQFSPTDKNAMDAFGREEFRPVIDGLTIGLKILLLFIGSLTLGIGGVGLTNIMLVSVEERVREIGLRRALGAKKRHIRLQFFLEAFLLTAFGGGLGMLVSYFVAAVTPKLPLLGAMMGDSSGRGDIELAVSFSAVLISTAVLVLVGVIAGLVPAMRASKLDPVDALRCD